MVWRGKEGKEGGRAPSKRPLEYDIPRMVAAAMAPLLTEDVNGRRRRPRKEGRIAAKICELPQTRETRNRLGGEVAACATRRQRRGEREGDREVCGEKSPQSAWWRAREEIPAWGEVPERRERQRTEEKEERPRSSPDQRSCTTLEREEAGSQLRGGRRTASRDEMGEVEEEELLLVLDTSSSPPSTLQYWHSLRDMRLTQKSHCQFWSKDRCHLGSQRKVFIRISHRCIHSHQRPDASSMESHHGQLVFFFSCENAKSRACSLVGGRPPTDRVQVAVAAHSRTLSEGRLTRKIGSAPPDLLHFFPDLCISLHRTN